MREQVIVPTLPNSTVHISGFARPAQRDSICSAHVHTEFEILTMYDGHTEFNVNEQMYIVEKGDIIFVNSRVPHSTNIYAGARAFYIQFGVGMNTEDKYTKFSKYLARFINSGSDDVVIFKKGTEINETLLPLLDKILSENIEKKPAYETFVKSYMYNILAVLYRYNVLNTPDSFFKDGNISKLLPVLEYIDNHYNEPITLEQLASILHVSEYHFCRMFKKTIKTSLVQYLNFVRVCKAEKMLISTDKSISEISFENGFSSVSYFNRIFKKQKSCTPGEYRKIQYAPGI